MFQTIEVLQKSTERAAEIAAFLEPQVELSEGEELNVRIFYKDEQAALVVFGWISTPNPDVLYSRPIDGVTYPPTWQVSRAEGTNQSTTIFDSFNLTPEEMTDIERMHYSQIVYPWHMLKIIGD
jgi:hypothetical protein